MAQKNQIPTNVAKKTGVKQPLSHKGFYALLLTTLLGMFIFVSYYASQQTQVYQSSAKAPSSGGAAGGSGAGGGGSNNCGKQTTKSKCNSTQGCKWNANKKQCVKGAGGGGGGGGGTTGTPIPVNCNKQTTKPKCNNTQGCTWDATKNQCVKDDGGTPTPTPGDGTPTDTPTPGGTGKAVFDLKLSFQGITSTPLSGQTTMDVKVTLSGGKLKDDLSTTGTFTVDGNGIWTGKVSFDGVEAGHKYKLLVKGPKHLQKKICDEAPTETVPGTYHCGDGDITVSTTDTNTLDFSAVKMLVGDLPVQDGVVDAYDISLIRNNIGSQDPKLLSEADLNLDGIIDSQDYSLLISSLSKKSDEN